MEMEAMAGLSTPISKETMAGRLLLAQLAFLACNPGIPSHVTIPVFGK
jgi:hypothetical protein